MMAMVNILAPITLITLIGYVLGKMSVGLQSRTLSALVILVATPALVFNTLVSTHVDGAAISQMSIAALFCIGVAGAISLVVLKITGGSVQSFLPSLMLPNSGNMGLPLVALTFGPEGARLGVAYFVVIALFQHSVGLSITSGTLRIYELARQPLLYAVAFVVLVLFFDIQVPKIILDTTEMLGAMMIPAMLILLGTSLATLKINDLGPAVSIAVGRLVIGVISALVVIYALDLTGVAAGAVFLLATMPSAIVTYVFAERFQQSANKVAGAVVMSTLLTFLCLPALVYCAQLLEDRVAVIEGSSMPMEADQ